VDFARPRVDPEALRYMAESSAYRAPGGIAYCFLGEAGLAYQALQDLDQPLLDSQHQVCLVMDGRLDNRAELIGRLEPIEGQAVSDAGLLLAAYLEWGESCFDHLLGDFAFVLWDAARKLLLCAVDPLGVKPLHYAHVGSLLIFASDAIQVLLHPQVPDDYNEREIAAYLASQAEDPARSFFTAIHKLAPGHRLIAGRGSLRVERYWSPRPGEIRYSRDEDYAARFLEILQQAVTDRLRGAGAYAGVAMSGGLDSTSVAALAQRTGSSIRAYTFVFDRLADCDERTYSGAMAEELGLEVEPVEAERLWSLESRSSLPHSPDTPFIGWRRGYEEILLRLASGGSRVLLMGHGGDDLLRGSSRVYAERLWRGDASAAREVLRHVRSRRDPILRSLFHYFGRPLLPPAADRLLRHRKRFRSAQRFASPARQEVYDNLVGMPWYWRAVNWHDRNSASFGIEVRHPFLDRRLLEYVLAIPGEQLFRLGCHKSLLRRSVMGILPERLRQRETKTRFTPFLDFVLLEGSAGEIGEMMRSPLAADLGFLDGGKLRSTYLGFLDRRTEESRRALWYAITLEIWLRRCEAVRHDRRREALARLAAV